jgi:hypothetical protein
VQTTGALVRQPHGGALRNGGPNKGGNGATPSVLRSMFRDDLKDYAYVLRDIASGECVQRARVPLLLILSHAECPNCGNLGLKAKDPENADLITIEGTVSASPSDRRGAVDTMAKYGIGTIREISYDEVKQRLADTVALLRNRLGDEAEPLIRELEPIWRVKK